MGFVPCTNVAEFAFIYSQNEQNVENVFHVLGTADWTALSLAQATQNFQTWENANALPNRSSHTVLIGAYARSLTTQNSPSIEITYTGQMVGTNSGALLPNNVTVAVAHRTGLAGRSFRGRTFWIGLTGSMIVENTLIGSYSVGMITAMNLLLGTTFWGNGGKLVVLSRKQNGADRGAGLATPVTNFTINNTLDSQRRRLPEHNRHR